MNLSKTLTCKFCKNSFVPRYNDQEKYCSPECNHRAAAQRQEKVYRLRKLRRLLDGAINLTAPLPQVKYPDIDRREYVATTGVPGQGSRKSSRPNKSYVEQHTGSKMVKCRYCCEEFEAPHVLRRYCSLSCTAAMRRLRRRRKR